MKKSKILSLIMTMIMVCTLFISTRGIAKASDAPECVDGSYLTNEDSSEVTVWTNEQRCVFKKWLINNYKSRIW